MPIIAALAKAAAAGIALALTLHTGR